MPLTKEEKEERLKKLRSMFNHKDLDTAEDGRSPNFSEQVKSDVEEIKQQGLYNDIKDWGLRCKLARLDKKWSTQHVANLLDVKHKSIQMQECRYAITKERIDVTKEESDTAENKNSEPYVDLFYLEAFSLIYHINPYDMLGLKNPHMVDPLGSLDNPSSKYCNVIFSSLYDENDSEKLERLENITLIGKMNDKAYEKFYQHIFSLKDMKAFKKVLDLEPLEDPSAENYAWMNYSLPTYLRSYQAGSDVHRIFLEAKMATQDLMSRQPERLRVLAQLSLGDKSVATMLRIMLSDDAGLPVDPRSLKRYAIDKIILGSEGAEKESAKHDGEERILRYANFF